MKTAKKRITQAELEASNKTVAIFDTEPALSMAAIFNVMRVLKMVNPGDAYYENYLSMRERYGEKFFDTYNVLWGIGIYLKPKRILEIGTRTGISLCQLLSSMDAKALDAIGKIVCVDPFDQWTSPNLVRANLKYLNLKRQADMAEIHPITSDEYFRIELAGDMRPLFDYVLVDGDHSKEQARKDLDNAVKFVAPGGIIVFDDISTAPGECALLDVWDAWRALHVDEFLFTEVMEGKGVAVAIKI